LQEIEEKIRTARQAALEDELRHIEEELEPRAKELALRWLRQEENVHQQTLQSAELDRRSEESVLKEKVGEALQRLDQERKKKEQRRAAEEEKRMRTEQDALRKANLDLGLEAKPVERAARSKNIFATTEPAGSTVSEGQFGLLISRTKDFLAQEEFHKALAEITKVLETDSTHQEALFLQRSIIETQEKVGVASTDEIAEEKKSVQAVRERAARRKRISRLVFVAGGIVVLAVAVFMFFQFRKSLFPRNVVISVLPFKSLSNNPDENVIGSSLAQEVVNGLGYFKSVAVMGYSSSSALEHSEADPTRALYGLGFPLALSGAIKFDQGKYLVDAKIVDSSGLTQWSHLYEKPVDQMAFLPDEIVNQVAGAFGTPADAAIDESFQSRRTQNGNAYVSYLRGLELMNHRDAQSDQMASQLFQQAFDQDRKFVQALARASLAIASGAEKDGDVSEKTLQSAEQLSQSCIDLDSSLGDPYLAQGKILALKKQYRSALKKFDEAMARSPHESDAYFAKARVYLEVGEYDDAIDALNIAFRRDPRNVELLQLFAFANQLKGDPREAMRYHEIVLSLIDDSTEYLIGPVANVMLFDPELILNYGSRVAGAFDRYLASHRADYIAMYRLARYLQVSGRSSDAAKKLDDVCTLLRAELRIHSQNSLAAAYLALALTRLGRFSDALQIASKAGEFGKANPEVLYRIAQVYTLQKKQEGLSILHNAVALNFKLENIVDADFYNFRDNPDYSLSIQMPLK